MIIFMKGYLILINLIGFLSMGLDKLKAKNGAWRIPEKRLFLYALLGGSLGSNLGMQLFRHKTRHWNFVIFMPLILIVQIVLVILVLRSVNAGF